MSKKSVVNPNPGSDGAILAEFCNKYFANREAYPRKGYSVFYNLGDLVKRDKLSTKERSYIQSKLIDIGKPHLWDLLKNQISGTKDGIQLTKSDYLSIMQSLQRIKTLERRIEQLENDRQQV